VFNLSPPQNKTKQNKKNEGRETILSEQKITKEITIQLPKSKTLQKNHDIIIPLPKNLQKISSQKNVTKGLESQANNKYKKENLHVPQQQTKEDINKGQLVNMGTSVPKGGEWLDCLSASEIDVVLNATTEAVCSAMEFYNFRRGRKSKEEFTKLLQQGVLRWNKYFVPMHLRHHWILLEVRGDGGHLHGDVFDSAPSAVVRKDVQKWLKGILQEVRFIPSMRQKRSSNECGIFVLANTIRLSRGLPVMTPPMPHTASLAHIRPKLARKSLDEVIKMIIHPEFPRLSGGDWRGDLSEDDINTSFNSLGIRAHF
jgi:hypothetical protein